MAEVKNTKNEHHDQSVTTEPLQATTYNEKKAENFKLIRQTADYYLRLSNFGSHSPENKKILKYYQAYNGKEEAIADDLNYVINPLNTDKAEYKNFPAKVRPYPTILRSSVDLLLGEFNKKPFLFDVLNINGDEAYNSFLDYKFEKMKSNLIQNFTNHISKLTEEFQLEPKDVPSPEEKITELNLSYKDAKALRGYRTLKMIEHEERLWEKWRAMFKDFTISGKVRSLKFPKDGKLDYRKLSVLEVDYDKSPDLTYIEDGKWAAVRIPMTISDFVDFFKDELVKAEIDYFQKEGIDNTPSGVLEHLRSQEGDRGHDFKRDKIDVFYTCFKSLTKIGILKYKDPITGEIQEKEVDEAYQVDKEAGEEVEWIWVNEVWQVWRAGQFHYFGIKPIEGQRSPINEFAKCKLPINGKNFSDTESDCSSIVSLIYAHWLLYIILTYRVELTIAKSKGKMVLIDKNVIPDDEDDFLYYGETTGWARIDRNKKGVDRTWNQYQVLDLDLFKSISELIKLKESVQKEAEDIIGITDFRKGAVSPSAGKGMTERAIYQGSVISDILFTGFEEFLETELQGLLDLSQFAYVNGKTGYYQNDEGVLEFLKISPEEAVNADFGVFVKNMAQETDKLNLMKQQINALAQRKDIKTSTMVDTIFKDSYIELKTILKKAEKEAERAEMALATSQQEAQQATVQLQNEFKEYESLLKIKEINAEWDRRDNNTIIEGQVNHNIKEREFDVNEVLSQSKDRLNAMQQDSREREKLSIEREKNAIKREEIAAKERMNKDNNKTKLKNPVSGERKK